MGWPGGASNLAHSISIACTMRGRMGAQTQSLHPHPQDWTAGSYPQGTSMEPTARSTAAPMSSTESLYASPCRGEGGVREAGRRKKETSAHWAEMAEAVHRESRVSERRATMWRDI